MLEGLAFTEGPRWHDGRLWFSDMHDLRVRTLDESGQQRGAWSRFREAPSGLGWLPDGRLLVVSMQDRRVLRWRTASWCSTPISPASPTYHCNDMVTDARGRSYVGNFGYDLHARDAAARRGAGAGRGRRPRPRRRREPALPERHRDHAGRPHADRGRVRRRLSHRLRHRRGRLALGPAAVGAAREARCPTASVSTPKARSGWRRRSATSCCACWRADA